MWATTLVLLSCLYPIFLFFVIGYTYFYTTQKVVIQESVQTKPVELSSYSFRKPEPTTVVVTVAELTTNKASESAAVAESSNTPEATSEAELSIREKVSSTSAEPQDLPIAPTLSIDKNVENAVQAASVKIINNASNVVIPSTSSIIIEAESAFERVESSVGFE